MTPLPDASTAFLGGTTGVVHSRILKDGNLWTLLYGHFKNKRQIGPCGVIASLLLRLALVCERLRWGDEGNRDRNTNRGENVSEQ